MGGNRATARERLLACVGQRGDANLGPALISSGLVWDVIDELAVATEGSKAVAVFIQRVREESTRLKQRYKLSSAAATEEAFNTLANAEGK